jgi:hypothetical protein
MAIACFRLFTVLPLLPDLSVPFFIRRMALSTRFDAASPYFRRPEGFRAAIIVLRLELVVSGSGPAGACCAREAKSIELWSPISNRTDMSSRTGMEAEAITRLTDGLQPPAIRAILVQCLTGEVAPTAAISRLLAVEGASTVRAAIDDVTHRAATISRAGDTMVRDRVDELTQIFVEKVSELTDVDDATKIRTGYGLRRASRLSESGDRDESRASE